MSVQYNIPSDIKEISGVKLGFIGAISSYKLDFNLIKYIAKNRPDYNILLIGEIGEGEPGTNVDDLYDYKNIHFLGPKKYNELPNYLSFMDAALLPNNINDYTDNMFPMKFFEYLSSGRNIVSVDLKSLKEFRDFCYLSKSYDEFVSNIDRVISGDIVPLDERLSLAKKYTYESRTKKMIKIIEDELRLN